MLFTDATLEVTRVLPYGEVPMKNGGANDPDCRVYAPNPELKFSVIVVVVVGTNRMSDTSNVVVSPPTAPTTTVHRTLSELGTTLASDSVSNVGVVTLVLLKNAQDAPPLVEYSMRISPLLPPPMSVSMMLMLARTVSKPETAVPPENEYVMVAVSALFTPSRNIVIQVLVSSVVVAVSYALAGDAVTPRFMTCEVGRRNVEEVSVSVRNIPMRMVPEVLMATPSVAEVA
jgi:hypothetical protein